MSASMKPLFPSINCNKNLMILPIKATPITRMQPKYPLYHHHSLRLMLFPQKFKPRVGLSATLRHRHQKLVQQQQLQLFRPNNKQSQLSPYSSQLNSPFQPKTIIQCIRGQRIKFSEQIFDTDSLQS